LRTPDDGNTQAAGVGAAFQLFDIDPCKK